MIWLVFVVSLVALFLWRPLPAWAVAYTLSNKQFNSLVEDGSTAVGTGQAGTSFGQVLSGYDGTLFQFLATNASGQLQVGIAAGGGTAVDDAAFAFGTDLVLPAGYVFDDVQSNDPEENDVDLARMDSKRSQTTVLESAATRGLYAEVLTAGADDTVNTTNGLVTYSALMGYESVGAVWDRLRMDTSGNLFVSLATALDSSIDSISIAVNDVIPQMDSTDHLAVSIYGFNAAAGDTQPTVTTTQADGLVNTLDTLNVSSFMYGFNGTSFDRLRDSTAFGLNVVLELDNGTNIGGSTQADDAAAPQSLNVAASILGYDEDDTNYDRIYSYDTDGDNVATEAEGTQLGVVNFPYVYDSSTSANWDRMTAGMVFGAGVPGTAVVLAVDNSSSCASALSLGYVRITPVAAGQSVAYCCRSGSSCSATTSDTPYIDGQYYQEMVTDAAANDVICCIDAAGTNTLNLFITPLTL